MKPHDVTWFMHLHPGHGNTLVGVWPTPIGVYVRSWREGGPNLVVTFYPMQPATRVVDEIGRYNGPTTEDQVSSDVISDYRNRCKEAGHDALLAATL